MELKRKSLILFMLMTLMISVVACGKKENTLSAEEVSEQADSFYQEIESLNEKMQELSASEEYLLVNGEGKKLEPSDVLDFSTLIQCMQKLEPYAYFGLLSSFMEESGYDVKDKSLQEVSDSFFKLTDSEKGIVLGKMFGFVDESPIEEGSEIEVQIFIVRAFQLIDKSTGETIFGNTK